MNFILFLCLALPQGYINLIMEGKYAEAINYCDNMIEEGKNRYKWELEKGDVYFDKIRDFEKASDIYKELIEKYKKKDGWLYYRLALALEMKEDYLNAAKSYEIVATQYRKFPLDSFALVGVERCFKKNYQDFVASVDGYKITRLELDERVGKGSRFAPKVEKPVLDQIILERLLYINALKYNIPEEEYFKENLSAKRRLLLIDEVYNLDFVEKAVPTEKEMKKYYKKNKKNYLQREEVRGKEIVVESDSLAQFILDSLQKHIESFDTLAKLYSTLPNKRTGGRMGVIYRGYKPAPVEEEIFKAELNTVVGVIPFDDKFGIYLVTEHKEERYRKFEEVKRQIEGSLKTENIGELEEKLIKKLKKKAKLKIFPFTENDSANIDDNRIVAIIGGREMRKDLMKKRSESPPYLGEVELRQEVNFNRLMDVLIKEELKIEYAERNKYFLNDGYISRLKEMVQRLMETSLYRKAVVEAVTVDSQDVVDYYNEHKEEFKVPEMLRCQEIVVKEKELARELHRILLEDIEKFDSLARAHSISPSASRGGELGQIRRGVKSEKFEDIVFKMEVGSLSKVFSTDESTYTIIRKIDHNPSSYRDIDSMFSTVEARLTKQKERVIVDALLENFRAESDIQIFLEEPEPEDEKLEEQNE